MKVCDQCKKTVAEGSLIHLRFENKWYPQLHKIEAEFCSLRCLREWIDGVEGVEEKKRSANRLSCVGNRKRKNS